MRGGEGGREGKRERGREGGRERERGGKREGGREFTFQHFIPQKRGQPLHMGTKWMSQVCPLFRGSTVLCPHFNGTTEKNSQRHWEMVPVNIPLLLLRKDLVQLVIQVLVNHFPFFLVCGTGKGTGHILLHFRRHVVLRTRF